MTNSATPHVEDEPEISATDLAARSGVTLERIEGYTAAGVLTPIGDGRHAIGDVHRVRALAAFETAGIPLEVLVRAQEGGAITFAQYDELHAPPRPPSPRSYAAFRASLGARARWLSPLFASSSLAEPDADTHLSADEEGLLDELTAIIEATEHHDLALRVVRTFAESARRSSEAALATYGEVVDREGAHELTRLPDPELYERVFRPWARLARTVPELGTWLTSHHISHAIDAYNVEATEQVLENAGYVDERPEIQPAIAFVDLAGFARMTEAEGDEVAARVALRLNEVAAQVAEPHGGRVVKLLGDGALVRYPSLESAIRGSLDLLESLRAEGLPEGHIGVHRGPVIARDGDVFGRTVNLAARLADAAAAGELFVVEELGSFLPKGAAAEPAGRRELRGIGDVQIMRVVRQPSR